MRIAALLPLVAAVAGLAGCVAEPPRHARRYYDGVPPPAVPAPPRMAELIVYPARGQSAETADRDRYECHTWAVRETHFDPSLVAPASPPPPTPAPAPRPGSGVAAGAVTGAVLGAIVAPHGDEGGGAAVGAIAGAILGGASEQARADEARDAEARREAHYAAASARQGDGAGSYRRAISACLEARGYTVK
jgi:hypothetical protein